MPADLVPNEAIPKLAAQIDSPAMLRTLRLLQQRGFLQNGPGVDQETVDALQRLAVLGLVDPGYSGPTNGEPFIWVSNHNGNRVLKHFEANRRREVKVHPRARTALAALSEDDQQAVLAATESLLIREPTSWPRGEVLRLDEGKPVFLLRVTPDLRAFITVLDSGDIELYDIVREETLKAFLERYRGGSKVG